jgi:hypothetical protein
MPADDPEWQARLAALLQGLQTLGWTVGRNLRIDYRLGANPPLAIFGRSRPRLSDMAAASRFPTKSLWYENAP